MNPDYSQEVFVFFHIPKTGGMSVNHLLKQNLMLGEEFIQLGTTGRQDEVENARLPLAERSEEECSHIRVIAGH